MSEAFSGCWWGLAVPEGTNPVRAWGARALLTLSRRMKPVKRKGKVIGRDYVVMPLIDVVSDRTAYRGPEVGRAATPAETAFRRRVSRHGMPQLQKTAVRLGLDPSDDQEIQIDAGKYHLRANPRKSYGYLYIVAWESAD